LGNATVATAGSTTVLAEAVRTISTAGAGSHRCSDGLNGPMYAVTARIDVGVRSARRGYRPRVGWSCLRSERWNRRGNREECQRNNARQPHGSTLSPAFFRALSRNSRAPGESSWWQLVPDIAGYFSACSTLGNR